MSYLFHTTFLSLLPRIAERGLRVGGRSQFSDGYSAHSRGRTFFSGSDGIAFWASKMEDIAHHNSDFEDEDEAAGWTPVVLRITEDDIDGEIEEDELGYKDSGYRASFYATEDIDPEAIEVWDGEGWFALDDEVVDDMLGEAADALDAEEYDDAEWFTPDWEMFVPTKRQATQK